MSVDVWVAPLLVPPATGAALVESLSPGERARAQGYRQARHARRFSVARGWLRHVLAAELGTSPADVHFDDGPGKPRLAGADAGVRFNLSHAEDLAVVVVGDREVGVDVEHRKSGYALDAAAVACSPVELAVLDRLPPGGRAEAFLALWTAKEAYLKATGVGLAGSPADVPVGDGDPAPVGRPGWWMRRLRPTPLHVGAVVAAGDDWDVRVRSTAALA